MTDVFISYSRKDKEFVRSLHEAIEESDRDAWVDWEDIPLTARWWEEVCSGIEGAHTFAFVISPDSVESQVCKQELDHAVENNKRIAPIWHRDVENEVVPPDLSSHQYIWFRENDDFNKAFDSLVEALDTDLEWQRAHTRLLTRAKEWESEARDDSFLLRGKDLEAAEALQVQETEKESRLTRLQKEYIHASRKSTTELQRRLLDAVKLGWLGGLAIMLSGMLYIVSALMNIHLSLNEVTNPAIFSFVTVIALVGAPLEVLGLICLYTRRLHAMGAFGLIAFPVAVSGGVLQTGTMWSDAFVLPSIEQVSAASAASLLSDPPRPLVLGTTLTSLLYSLGWSLFGTALLRARLYNSLVLKMLVGCSLLYGALAVADLAVTEAVARHPAMVVYSAVLIMLFNAVLAVLGFTTLYDAGYKGRRWWQQEGILSAVAVCFAGVVWIFLGVLLAFNDSEWVDNLGIVVLVMGWAGTLAGLIGLHFRLSTRFRKAGWTGFLIALIGIASIPVVSAVLFELIFAALGGVLVGFLFLGIAALGSRVLPRWCGVVLMLAIPASCISGIAAGFTLSGQAADQGIWMLTVFSLLFGVFWLTLGYVLWSRRGITSDYKPQTRAGQTVATIPNDFPK